MRSREIQKYLADMTARPIGEIDQRIRPLRKTMEISTGPRGIRAPHMDLVQTGMHILSLASQRVTDAFDVAKSLMDLRLVPHPEFPDLTRPFLQDNGNSSFIAMLAMAMSDGLASARFEFKYIELSETGSFAVVHLDRGSLKNLRFIYWPAKHLKIVPEDKTSGIYNLLDHTSFDRRLVISCQHLRSLGERVIAECEGGIGDQADALSAEA